MKKYIFILLLILIPIQGFSQFEQYLQQDPQPTTYRQRGLAFSMVELGAGIGAFIKWPLKSYWHVGMGFDGFMLRDSKEFSYIDIYGYPRTVNGDNNVYILDFMFTAKKRMFAKDLDDNVRPFLEFGVGPVYGMNFPEYDTKPDGTKTRDQYSLTLGGLIAAGIDANVSSKNFLGIRLQYRFFPFTETIGERKDQSTFDLRLEVGQRF